MTGRRGAVVDTQDVLCRFGSVTALNGVDLSVSAGQIHALLGPNGAGKTTLLRVLSGAVIPTSGAASVAGRPPDLLDARGKQAVSVVPADDRSFYLRLSGLENLVFFGRLEGLPRRAATRRAHACLTAVGLATAAERRVGLYSHGMKKRLSMARALLTPSRAFILDEATHDLDAEGAQRIRRLVSDLAAGGAAVVWATQILDEIRGFAHAVTVLHRGEVCFRGTVGELVRTTTTRQFVLQLAHPSRRAPVSLERLRSLVGAWGTVDPAVELDHVHLGLHDDAVLGDVLATLTADGVQVLSCHEEQSLVEAAMRRLTADADERAAVDR